MQPHVKGDRSRELLLCRVDLCCTGTGDISITKYSTQLLWVIITVTVCEPVVGCGAQA